jgi:hypothetical protein
MAEAAAPTPESAQQETPQPARSEQNATPAPASTATDKGAAPRERKAWKHLGYAGAAIGTLTLAVGFSVYDGLRTAGNGPGRGRKPDAALRDPHTDANHRGKETRAEDGVGSLRLAQYRSEAEQALILASFYEHEGPTDKLRKCLEALTRWRQAKIAMHGEPRFTDADGLVIRRTPEETIDKDIWERVTNARRRLSQQLDEPAGSGTGIVPASTGKR